MTEDRRVARNPAEPHKSEPAGAERWIGYLDWVRGDVVDGVLALSEEQRRHTLLPSGWTPIELLSHIVHMEQRWFVWGFLGEPVGDPWGDWTADRSRWQVPDDVTAAALAARSDEVAERTRWVLRHHSLDSRAAPGGRFDADPPTLEWICFHVLAEYARHAGHLDIVVELSAPDR